MAFLDSGLLLGIFRLVLSAAGILQGDGVAGNKGTAAGMLAVEGPVRSSRPRALPEIESIDAVLELSDAGMAAASEPMLAPDELWSQPLLGA